MKHKNLVDSWNRIILEGGPGSGHFGHGGGAGGPGNPGGSTSDGGGGGGGSKDGGILETPGGARVTAKPKIEVGSRVFYATNPHDVKQAAFHGLKLNSPVTTYFLLHQGIEKGTRYVPAVGAEYYSRKAAEDAWKKLLDEFGAKPKNEDGGGFFKSPPDFL